METEVELSVVIPVLNEARNVEPLVKEIGEALDGVVEYEIVYVDDGSTDGTPERLAALRGQLPAGRLRVLRHRRNYGQSAALHTGVEAARARWIATLDGDGQNDPADIPKLLALRDATSGDGTSRDATSGDGTSRDATSGDGTADLRLISSLRRKRRDSWLRRVSSRIANAVRQRLLHDRTSDSASGLKLFSRDAFLELPYFDHMHRFIPALIQRGGGEMLTVEVNHRPRGHGESKYGMHNRLWIGIVDMLGVMWLQRRFVAPEVEEIP